MVKLPFRPAPFFDNKNAAFWNLQFAGWGGVFALRAVSAFDSVSAFISSMSTPNALLITSGARSAPLWHD